MKKETYVFAYFQFDHFPKSKIDFESSFEMRRSKFMLYIFFLERFEQQKKSWKSDFPLYFQILRKRVKVFFSC